MATLGGSELFARDHVCVFYRGSAELDRLLIPFLREGLLAGHACRCFSFHDAEAALRAQLSDVIPLAPGRLDITGPNEGHRHNGRFDPDWMVTSVETWLADQPRGPAEQVLRGVGDMSWASGIESDGFIEELVAYEQRITDILRDGPPLVALCFFDLDKFGAEVAMPVIQSHPRIWLGGAILDNPYVASSMIMSGQL